MSIDDRAGNDDMTSCCASDILIGSVAIAEIDDAGGAHTLYGVDNEDILSCAAGGNASNFGADYDDVYADGGNDTVFAVDGIDNSYAGLGNDTVYGGSRNDGVDGDGGDDVATGYYGQDTVYAGDGVDNAYGFSCDDSCVLSVGGGENAITAFDTTDSGQTVTKGGTNYASASE